MSDTTPADNYRQLQSEEEAATRAVESFRLLPREWRERAKVYREAREMTPSAAEAVADGEAERKLLDCAKDAEEILRDYDRTFHPKRLKVFDEFTVPGVFTLNPISLHPTGFLQKFIVTKIEGDSIEFWPRVNYPDLKVDGYGRMRE